MHFTKGRSENRQVAEDLMLLTSGRRLNMSGMSEEHKQESWRAVDLLFHAPDGTSIKLHGSDIERFSQRCVINLAGHLLSLIHI